MAYAITSRRRAGRMPVTPARKRGTWKLAYADFLTALVAFFLLMWLVNGVSREDRAIIAGEFTSHPHGASPDLPAGQEAEDLAGRIRLQAGIGPSEESLRSSASQAGIRLELVDTAGRPLFDTGSGALTDEGRALVQTTGEILAGRDYFIAIEGHTDAFTLASGEMTNWELSSARANEARRALEKAGVMADRIRAVTGYADTRPLNPGQPHLAANRRISLLLTRPEGTPPAAAGPLPRPPYSP